MDSTLNLYNSLNTRLNQLDAEFKALGRNEFGGKRVLQGEPGSITQAVEASIKALRDELSKFEASFQKTVAELREQQKQVQPRGPLRSTRSATVSVIRGRHEQCFSRHPDVSLETAVNEVFAQLGIPAN